MWLVSLIFTSSVFFLYSHLSLFSLCVTENAAWESSAALNQPNALAPLTPNPANVISAVN